MPVVPIVTYPDPRLKQVCDAVAAFDSSLHNLIRDLVDTLDASPGCVGIAAPQIGVLYRVVVIDVSRHSKPFPNHGLLLLVNPNIEEQAGDVVAREGCLSVPDFTANVRRADSICVSAQSPDGNTVNFQATGFETRVILHECDHLDGILFLDRVVSLKTDVFRRKRYTPPVERSR